MKGLKQLITSCLITIAIVVMPLYAQTQTGKWTPVKEVREGQKPILKQPDIEVFSQSSRISVNVNSPVNIKIFTILGKLVSSQDLEPGFYEYYMPTHGIFIIKTSETTCKVAI